MLVTVGACVLSVGANVDDVTVGALVELVQQLREAVL